MDDSYSVLDIEDYIKYIIKTSRKPSIHIYINKINRLVFKIKDGYKLELQTPETIKIFRSTKKLIGKTKNRENVTSLEIVEVVSM